MMEAKKYRLQFLFLQTLLKEKKVIMQRFGFEYDNMKTEFANDVQFLEYIDREHKWDELDSEYNKQ